RGMVVFARMRRCVMFFFFFSSRRRHTRLVSDWSSDVCSSDLRVSEMNQRLCVASMEPRDVFGRGENALDLRRIAIGIGGRAGPRSEERRVGKEWRSRGGAEY